MNLVVGATGLVGRETCLRLRQAAKPVRAMVRPTSNPDAVSALRAAGVEIVNGDLKDRASIEAACRGVSTVITTASSTLSRQEGDSIEAVDRAGQLALVDAAKAAGVKHFVFVSFDHANMPVSSALVEAKAAVERAVIASGMDYTILQPSMFMEVWLSPAVGFDVANAKATIYGSGEQKLNWISFRDVAAFAAACVDNPATKNVVLPLGGPASMTPAEVVRVFEEATGRKFDVQHVPEAALRAQYDAAADPMQKSMTAIMLMYARGDSVDMRGTLQRLPMKLKSVQDFAREVTAAR
jgi:uncharacterized protein YbjT (DUF2867 family)